jgi:parallel beta-helix repeat protein
MTFDLHANLAYGIVIGPPGQSGTQVEVQAGAGSAFPTPPFNMICCPPLVTPTSANAEIVRVTSVNGVVLTIQRAQESSTQQNIQISWQCFAGPTVKTFTDIEAAVTANAAAAAANAAAILTEIARAEAAEGALSSGVAANSGAIAGALAAVFQDISPQTPVTTSGNLAANSLVPINGASTAVALALPATNTIGQFILTERVDDGTLTGAGAVTITGKVRGTASSTLPLKLLNESILFVALGGGNWWPLAGHKTLASMDARYVLASTVGQPNGPGTLDSTGHQPISQAATTVQQAVSLASTAAQVAGDIEGTATNPQIATVLGGQVPATAAGLAAETTARVAGAGTNAMAIASEATSRASADSAEATARGAADSTEITARQAADTALQTNITAEATARAAAITAEATARAAVAAAALQASNNLSDLASAITARASLGLGTIATMAATAFGAVGSDGYLGTPGLSGTGLTPAALLGGGGKPSYWVDAPPFNAKGDGVTDDTAAINAAITALIASGGGHLLFTPGKTYYTAGGITATGLNHCILEGSGATLLCANQANTVLAVASSTNVHVHGLRVTHGAVSAAASSGHGIYIGSCSQFSVTDCEASQTNCFGITVHGSLQGVVANNRVHNTGADGINLGQTGTIITSDIAIVGNQIYSTGDDAISTEGVITSSGPISNILIVGNSIDYSGSRGIYISGVTGATISGNMISNTACSGILVQQTSALGTVYGSSYINVVANTILNANTPLVVPGCVLNGTTTVTNPAGFPGVSQRSGGLTVTGTDIAGGTTVGTYYAGSNSLTLSQAATANATVSLTFTRNAVFQAIQIAGGSATYPLQHIVVADNLINGCNGGIYGSAGVTGAVNDLTIHENQIYSSTVAGASFNYVQGLDFSGNRVDQPLLHGIDVLATCTAPIRINRNLVTNPNQSAAANGYGIYVLSGNAQINDNVVTDTAGNLVHSFYLGSAANNIMQNNWDVNARGVAQAGTGNIIRGNVGINPCGVIPTAVPASGTAVPANSFDRTFYVTPGTGGCTMAISGGPSPVVPAGSLGAIRVPAGTTVTPTYTNTPAWVVEGE